MKYNKKLGLNDQNHDEYFEFIRNYCGSELTYDELKNEEENIQDINDLMKYLDNLKQKYNENDSQLAMKVYYLDGLYKSVISIMHNRSYWTGINNPNNPITLRRRVPIGQKMVPQMPLKNSRKQFSAKLEGTIGNTLLVNSNKRLV